MSAWILFVSGSNLSNIGKANAAVLPVPVWAWPIISFLPLSKSGITPAWIGLGCIYHFFSILFSIVSYRPKSENFILSSIM